MIVRKIPIEYIKEAAYNPRKDLKPGDAEYERIKRSIEEFDLVEPLVWNEHNGVLIGGHQRLKVLKERGDHEADVSVVNIKDPQRERALNIVLNKANGEWDFPRLKELLIELDDGNFDLTLTGFDEFELKELIDYEGRKGLTDDDEAPERPSVAKTKPGDIYALGPHRVMCGDATKLDDANALLEAAKADLCFTDPPYGVNYEEKAKNILGRRQGAKITGDDSGKDILKTTVRSAFGVIADVLKVGGPYYVCSPQGGELGLMMMMMMEAGIECRHMIVWGKDSPVFSMGRLDYDYQHEPILYGWRGSHKHYGNGSHRTSLWLIPRPKTSKLHPTMKPVEVVENAILNSSKTDDIVYDPFGGSGTTIIACEKTGRAGRTLEIDPCYCDVIVKRWEDFTGKKAELIRGKRLAKAAR